MNAWLERLRQKPLAQRQRYAYLGSTIITGLIVVVWFTTQSVGVLEPMPEAEKVTEQKGALSRFFSTVSSQVASVWQSQIGSESPDTAAQEATSTPNTSEAKVSPITLPHVSGDARMDSAEQPHSVASSSATTTASRSASTTTASPAPRHILIGTSSPETID